MPGVSVILPAFDRLVFLEAAIDSVLAQTYADWELVIADDGSAQETRAYLQASPTRAFRFYGSRIAAIRVGSATRRSRSPPAGTSPSWIPTTCVCDSQCAAQSRHLTSPCAASARTTTTTAIRTEPPPSRTGCGSTRSSRRWHLRHRCGLSTRGCARAVPGSAREADTSASHASGTEGSQPVRLCIR
jgi:glycosyl transferase family 2